MAQIQWYPGHMTKSVRMMRENIALVDVVIELLDARIPKSSQNPDIAGLARNKRRIIVLNKADTASSVGNDAWLAYFSGVGVATVSADSASGKGLEDVRELAVSSMAEKHSRQRARGRLSGRVRAMVVGIPNVGKSTFINRLVGRPIAKAADKPGVTRAKQWVRIIEGFELLDTPGILWPKFEEPEVGLNLAITGAISDKILHIEELAQELISIMMRTSPEALHERYKIEQPQASVAVEDGSAAKVLEDIARARSMLLRGGCADTERAAITLIDEFRGGKLGRVSLELPPE